MNRQFSNVIFAGPHYQLRGGMASVLKVYAQTIDTFLFLPTYKYTNPIAAQFYFAGACLKLFWWLLTKPSVKIVHIHTASRGSFFRKSILVLIAKLFRKKAILHIHAGEFKIFYQQSGFKKYILYILRITDELICLSGEWKEYFEKLTGKNCVVLNNPVIMPPAVATKGPVRPLHVLFLNHINKHKGLFDLTNYIRDNQNWLRGNFTFVIAGAGETVQLEKFIADNQLQDIIDFKGWVEGSTKQQLINDCDIFILPSYNEGLPVSILEAMASKKAIIATSVGGIPRIVKPGINGWLMKPADTSMLDLIFKEIAADMDVTVTYGQASFEIAQDYSPEKVKDELSGIYNALIAPAGLSVNQLNYEKRKRTEA